MRPTWSRLVGERLRVRIRARDVSFALSAPRDASFLNVLPGVVAEMGSSEGPSVDVAVAVGRAVMVARITRKSVDTLQPGAGKASVRAGEIGRDRPPQRRLRVSA